MEDKAMHGVEHLGFAFCPNCAIIEALSTLFRRLLLWALFDERTMSLTRRRSVASDRPDTLDIPGRAPPCQRMASCSCETMLLVEGRATGTEPRRRRSVKAEAFLRDGLKEEDHLWVNVVIISQTTSRRRPNDSAANHP
ncbi:hypothetical protein B296_00025583 [Ensete ventricosum]|uniref:Uncharacterized protein n=1 Tax=Ensete ventricosum TaxID=4639 RepID=A0A426ZUU1_ENSVE|nr:hypothetical protein B296_00025583 [Ensete ventricosum]